MYCLKPKIVLIEEGGFPVDIGGISTWVRELIEGLKEFEFTILTITTHEKSDLILQVPEGIKVRIHILFSRRWKHKAHPDTFKGVIDCLKLFLSGERVGIEEIVELMANLDPIKVLCSREFWEMAKEAYEELNLYQESFIGFAYELACIFRPLLEVLLLGTDLKGFDIVHSTNAGLAGLAGAAAKVKWGYPLVLTEHGSFLREFDIWLERTRRKRWSRELLKRVMNSVVRTSHSYANSIVSVSESIRKDQLKIGASEEKLLVIRNGVDASKFERAITNIDVGADVSVMNRKIGKDYGEVLRVVTVSRVDKVKGIDLLARAAAFALSSGVRLVFEVVGPITDKEYLEEIQALTKSLGISRNFKIIGVRDVKNVLDRADIFVLPSRSEGSPFALLEAMAASLPIIGTGVGGIPEVLGDAGILVKPEPKELASVIEKLAKDAELRRKLGKAARERVISNFPLEKMIDGYRNLYLKLMEEKPWYSSV